VNAVMKFRVQYNAGRVSSGHTTGGLSSSAQFHRVPEEVTYGRSVYKLGNGIVKELRKTMENFVIWLKFQPVNSASFLLLHTHLVSQF
jgi:hypothetical protein